MIFQVITSALGGNVAAKLLWNLSLDTLGNTIAGILFGVLGDQLLDILGVGTAAEADGSTNLYTILDTISGVGGGLKMIFIGAIIMP